MHIKTVKFQIKISYSLENTYGVYYFQFLIKIRGGQKYTDLLPAKKIVA